MIISTLRVPRSRPQSGKLNFTNDARVLWAHHLCSQGNLFAKKKGKCFFFSNKYLFVVRARKKTFFSNRYLYVVRRRKKFLLWNAPQAKNCFYCVMRRRRKCFLFVRCSDERKLFFPEQIFVRCSGEKKFYFFEQTYREKSTLALVTTSSVINSVWLRIRRT